VISLLGDANILRHVALLAARLQAEPWKDFADYLQLHFLSFSDLGLDPSDPDDVVWSRCQERQVLLLTNNRNDDGPKSLQSTIQRLNQPHSLPVFTIGNADSILTSAEYADRVIDRLLRYLLELDNVRGTGRLFIP